jgi:hypothetical protein
VILDEATAFTNLSRLKPRKLVEHVNLFVVSRARRFVWAKDETEARFIQNHMSKNLEPTPLFPGIGQYPSLSKAS